MTAPLVLVVDDDPSVTASLGLLLKQHGYRTRLASTPDEALAAVADEAPQLVLADMNFSRETSGREGLELLARLRERCPGVPVILITAWGSIALAVEGMKAGAADFITKPWTNAHLLRAVETVLSLADGGAAAPQRAMPSRQELDEKYDLAVIVGADPALVKVLEVAARVAPTDASVLISGESGTGKELVAEAIHRNSRRREGPFVKVNLGGISSTLFESEMFGHVKGAFTDARGDRKGRFEVADGGTIFLDEIGDVEPSAQVKLLRVLQDRTYEVLGSSITRSVDVRVISATNRDLPELVRTGAFREDLFYRLNLITIRLPALRERPGDVARLARHFLAQFGEAYGRPLTLTEAAAGWLTAQPWPGNIRQLRQTIERAVLVLDGNRLDAADLAALSGLETPVRTGAATLGELERATIETALREHEGNLTRVAEALGLSRAALYRRLRKHGLHTP